MSRTVGDLLVLVPRVYAELTEALVPGGGASDGERVAGGGSVTPPAPARLDVAEHRHTLVRGLRWWVDAVRDRGEHTKVGQDPTRMCAWLLGHLEVMAPEDRAELATNLTDWLHGAYPFMGKPEPVTRATLPPEALDAIVPVHVAAKVLGVSVRTVQRRAPDRDAGTVRLRDVATLCPHDLVAGHCGDCAA